MMRRGKTPLTRRTVAEYGCRVGQSRPKGQRDMKLLFGLMIALTLTGCEIPDLDVTAFRSSSSAPTPTAPGQPAAPKSDTGQAAENTGDYSNYF
jgi:hypothetical protein